MCCIGIMWDATGTPTTNTAIIGVGQPGATNPYCSSVCSTGGVHSPRLTHPYYISVDIIGIKWNATGTYDHYVLPKLSLDVSFLSECSL